MKNTTLEFVESRVTFLRGIDCGGVYYLYYGTDAEGNTVIHVENGMFEGSRYSYAGDYPVYVSFDGILSIGEKRFIPVVEKIVNLFMEMGK